MDNFFSITNYLKLEEKVMLDVSPVNDQKVVRNAQPSDFQGGKAVAKPVKSVRGFDSHGPIPATLQC